MATTTYDEILDKIEKFTLQDNECKIWNGSMCMRYNRPRLLVLVDGNKRHINIQRYKWNSNNNITLHTSDIIRTSCNNAKCVNIGHFIVEKRKNEPNYCTPDEKVLEHINKNITIKEDCKLWNLGSMGNFNRPVSKKYVNGRQRDVDVQRFIWNLTHEKITRCNILQTSCGNQNCVSEKHLIILPKAEPPNWGKIWSRMLEKTKLVDKCLIWTASRIGNYGQTTIQGKNMSAHRASYLVKTMGADIPSKINGLTAQIRHICGESLCVNPDHLEISTILENASDKRKHGTQPMGENSTLAKITEEVALKIKLSKFDKNDPRYETQKQRAIRFGTTHYTVSAIDTGGAWTHLGGVVSNSDINARVRKRKKENMEKVWTDEDYEKAGTRLYNMVIKSGESKKFKVDGDCWNFTGFIQNNYGSVSIMGKRKGAHVMSCEIKEKRPIVKGEHTVHLCGNSICIAPHHLCFNTVRFNSLSSLKNSKVSKLTEDNVRKIRNLVFSKKDLAIEFDVSEDTIRNVRDGRTWTHVI